MLCLSVLMKKKDENSSVTSITTALTFSARGSSAAGPLQSKLHFFNHSIWWGLLKWIKYI